MSIALLFRRATDAALSLIYPPHCVACGVQTSSGIILCGNCEDGIRPIEAPFCQRCSMPFQGEITGEFTCSNCQDREFHFTASVSRYRARGVVRDLIHRFKYSSEYHLRHQLAEWAAAGLSDERLQNPGFDALVPIPLHSARKREREFNQAEVIAELLSERCKKPVLNVLQRIRYTESQTRHDRTERMENLRGAFRMRQPDAVLNRHLVLVDDVFTTGSTVEECARVLTKAGAASVRALVVARR
jgi:competence protein ComFC